MKIQDIYCIVRDMSTIYGFSKSALDRPTRIKHSASEGVFVYADMSGPLRYSHSLSIKSKIKIISPVISLLFSCRPPAIGRFVITRRINAINRMIGGGARSHIFIKRLKGIIPPFTDAYSNSAIIGIIDFIWIIASALYPNPCFIFRSTLHAMRGITGIAVRTALRSSFVQRAPQNRAFIPALATTKPVRSMIHVTEPKDSPFSEFFPSKFKSFSGHNIVLNLLYNYSFYHKGITNANQFTYKGLNYGC